MTLAAAGIPFWYRYVHGAKSHISVSRLSTVEDAEWRDGRNNSQPIWSKRIRVQASNNGWRDGVINDIKLEEVVVWEPDGESTVIAEPSSGVHKIELEHFSPSDGRTRVSLQEGGADYGGQAIAGRSDERMAVLPFILQQSEVGEALQRGQRARFTFVFSIEDSKRFYSTKIDVTTDVTESSGRGLAR